MNWFAVPLAGVLGAACLSAAEWRVPPGDSVADAVARAAAGDTVFVAPGVYTGNLVIEKTLRLIGTGRPVLRGLGRGSVVTVRAPRCEIRGFRIERSGGSLIEEDSGIILYSDGNRIVDNELDDILFGIYFYHSNDNIVRHNRVRGRTRIEQGERGAGLHLWDCLRNVIEDNTVSETRDGMYLQNASESAIRRNIVTRVRYGLHYMYSNDNVFEENVFDRNVAGAAIMYSSRIELRRNRFEHNRGFSSFGILFQDSAGLAIEHNAIADNAVGIFMEGLRDSTFRQNLVAGNDTAVQVFSSAANNRFYENNFIGNLSPISVVGRGTTTVWSRGARGNYWSEYDGYDLDADGIGDVPHRIRNFYERLEGNYPRLRLYFYSPAAQALAAAERAFPIIRAADEQDPHPLMKPVVLPIAVRAPAHSAGGLRELGAIGASALAAAVFLLRRKSRSDPHT
ncbi:MAG TPA: nitrous oxide reductase family maturation protein NosD [Bryobacteraceae bacterium]|nr:nitrous oxide reductase family maturation protein NosD [Bryobacteraceae bacterium]